MAFSCPWNWINYCINEGNSTIGDINECPYQVCFDGYAVLNTNKFLLTDFNDQSKMIHRMSTVLTPAYCFFLLTLNGLIMSMNLIFANIVMK